MRYIRGTLDFGLIFDGPGRPNALQLVALSDAGWAEAAVGSHSRMGHFVELNGAAIFWKSHMQTRVADSTTDAEYIALGEASKSVICLRELTGELNIIQTGPTDLLGDNTASVALANNPTAHFRTRHICIAKHLIREHVKDGIVSVLYLPTKEQTADIFTKALDGPLFTKHRTWLGVDQIAS